MYTMAREAFCFQSKKRHLWPPWNTGSAEGQSFRRMHDLALSNASLSLFPMTWTVMPEIDENSPLAGYGAERLADCDAHLFLTIEERDNALGALVHDMRIYTAVDVLFGIHYAEAVTLDDQRRPVADLTRLSLVEPDHASP